jgi:uncharacterized RDD family membrane protein YckC
MASEAKLDTTVSIVTPENIEFAYRLAGPFRRFAALIVDALIKYAILVMVIVLAAFAQAATFTSVFAPATFFLAWFFLTWFYGMFWETLWSGQTPGKRLFSLRVISVDGRPINGAQAAIRNLLRLADSAPMVSLQIFASEAPPVSIIPTFLVGLTIMVMTRRFQRLGDLAAFTMVIAEQRDFRSTLMKVDDPRAAALAEYIPADFRISPSLAKALSLYVSRRNYLSTSRRAELAGHLARPLIETFGFMSDTSTDLLLCALYLKAFYGQKKEEEGGAIRGVSPFANSVASSTPLPQESLPDSYKIATAETVVVAVVTDAAIDVGESSIAGDQALAQGDRA